MTTAREREDWATVAQEQVEDPDLPDIVAFDPELDDRCDETLGCLAGEEVD